MSQGNNFFNLDHAYLSDIGATDFQSTLPVQAIPFTKKNKAWKEQTMDRLESIGMYQTSKNISFRDYYKMYEGRLVYQDLDDTASTVQDVADFRMEEMNIPTFIKHFDIIGIIINQLSGEFDSQKDKIRVDSIDDFSKGEYFREKNAQIRDYAEKYFDLELKRLLVIKGINPDIENQEFETEEQKQQILQQLQAEKNKLIPPDEIERTLSKDFKTVITEWAERTLEADSLKFDMEDMDMDELVDYLLTGRYFRHYHIGDDYYKPETWKPETTFFSQDLDLVYPQDGEYIGKIHFLSGADVVQRYGDKLSKKEQESLYGYSVEASPSDGVSINEVIEHGIGEAKIVPDKAYFQRQVAYSLQNALGVPMGKQYYEDENGEQHSDITWLEDTRRNGHLGARYAKYLRDDIDVRDDLIQVTEAYWRSYKLVGLLTIENTITEESYQTIVEEDLLKDFLKDNQIKQLRTVSLKEAKEKKEIDTIAWFYVPQVWQGKKINASNTNLQKDLYFDIEPLPFQIRGDSNYFDVKLPVAGIITSSIAQKIRPYQIEYNIAMNMNRSLLEKELGMFFMMDYAFLPTQYKNEIGETTKELIEEWREGIKDVGFGFFDASPSNTQRQNQNQTLFQAFDITFINQINRNISLAEFYQRKAYEQIGITPQRLGSPNEYESVEGTKQGVQASFAQTERIYRRFNTAKRKERELHLTVAQYCVKDNKDISVNFKRPDGENIIKKFTDDNFWLRKISIIPINDSAQRKSLEQFRNFIMQNNTMDSDILDYAKVFTSDSFTTLVKYAQQSRKRQEESLQATRQHEQEMLDKKLQSDERKNQYEKQFEASENQKDRENKLREAEIDAAAKISDNNLNPQYLSVISDIAEKNLKQENNNKELELKQRKEDREDRISDTEVQLAMERLRQDREKVQAQREKSRNDLLIARINKN